MFCAYVLIFCYFVSILPVLNVHIRSSLFIVSWKVTHVKTFLLPLWLIYHPLVSKVLQSSESHRLLYHFYICIGLLTSVVVFEISLVIEEVICLILYVESDSSVSYIFVSWRMLCSLVFSFSSWFIQDIIVECLWLLPFHSSSQLVISSCSTQKYVFCFKHGCTVYLLEGAFTVWKGWCCVTR
jgi:hypothetical protein